MNTIAANIYSSLRTNSGISALLTDVLDPHTTDKAGLLFIPLLNVIKNTYTIISCDVNFCYPDRVPLTQLVHIAKKILVYGPEFSAEFSLPPKFSGGVRKNSCAQVGRETPTFTLQYFYDQ